jgi:hypothetical protein
MLLEISPIGTSEFSVSSYFYLLYANPFYSHPSDPQSVFTFWLGNHSLYTGPQGRDGHKQFIYFYNIHIFLAVHLLGFSFLWYWGLNSWPSAC